MQKSRSSACLENIAELVLVMLWKVTVARGFSQKYRTLVVPMSVAQNIQLWTHALSGIIVIFIPDKEQKYQTVHLNIYPTPGNPLESTRWNLTKKVKDTVLKSKTGSRDRSLQQHVLA